MPKGAFYAFPNVKRTGWKAKPLASSLLEDSGVALIGGPDFGILGEGYVRAVLRQLDREHPEGARPDGRVSVVAKGGVIQLRHQSDRRSLLHHLAERQRSQLVNAHAAVRVGLADSSTARRVPWMP